MFLNIFILVLISTLSTSFILNFIKIISVIVKSSFHSIELTRSILILELDNFFSLTK